MRKPITIIIIISILSIFALGGASTAEASPRTRGYYLIEDTLHVDFDALRLKPEVKPTKTRDLPIRIPLLKLEYPRAVPITPNDDRDCRTLARTEGGIELIGGRCTLPETNAPPAIDPNPITSAGVKIPLPSFLQF